MRSALVPAGKVKIGASAMTGVVVTAAGFGVTGIGVGRTDAAVAVMAEGLATAAGAGAATGAPARAFKVATASS